MLNTNLDLIKKKIIELNSQGFSDNEISKNLNLDLKYVNNWRLKLNLPKNLNGKLNRASELTKEIIQNLYFEKSLSMLEIGKLYNCSETTVKNYMKILGISSLSPTHRRDQINPKFKEIAKKPEEYRQEALDLTRKQFCDKYQISVNQYNELKQNLGLSPKRSGYSQWRNYKSDTLSEEQLNLIIGSMLGDGKLRKEKYGVVFSEFHSNHQLGYLYKKADVLKNHLYKIEKDDKSKGEFLITKPISQIEWIFDAFYPKGSGWKIVPNFVIDNFKIEWLPYWFLDDGSSYDQPRISNEFLNIEQKIKLKEKLENLKIKVTFTEKGKYLDIKEESYPVFYNSLQEIVTLDTLYKIPENFRKEEKLNRESPIWKKQWEILISDGFPYPEISEGNWEKRTISLFNRPLKYDSRHSYDILCNPFYPQMWNHLLPIWEKEKEKLLLNRIKYADRVSKASLLTGLKLMSKETRSNFCPNLAKGVIDLLSNKKPIKVLDYSSGFGGRLLGCFLSNPQNQYYGIDPWDKNIESSFKMLSSLEKIIPNCTKQYFPYNQGSEILISSLENTIDLAFSSPPYFTHEQYCKDPSQSVIKYPKYIDWLKYYWEPTVENIKKYLKCGSTLALNITDIKGYNLCEDMVKIILDKGFTMRDTLYFTVTSRMYNKKDLRKEPIYIFKK